MLFLTGLKFRSRNKREINAIKKKNKYVQVPLIIQFNTNNVIFIQYGLKINTFKKKYNIKMVKQTQMPTKKD